MREGFLDNEGTNQTSKESPGDVILHGPMLLLFCAIRFKHRQHPITSAKAFGAIRP